MEDCWRVRVFRVFSRDAPVRAAELEDEPANRFGFDLHPHLHRSAEATAIVDSARASTAHPSDGAGFPPAVVGESLDASVASADPRVRAIPHSSRNVARHSRSNRQHLDVRAGELPPLSHDFRHCRRLKFSGKSAVEDCEGGQPQNHGQQLFHETSLNIGGSRTTSGLARPLPKLNRALNRYFCQSVPFGCSVWKKHTRHFLELCYRRFSYT